MREATGSSFSLQIMVLFILIFSAFLVVVINYSKAYMVKNDMLGIVEKYEGIHDESRQIINDYLHAKSYNSSGYCPDGWYGVKDISENVAEKAKKNKKYNYCYIEESKNDDYYTKIKVFFKFNLPVIGELVDYGVNGTTNVYRGYKK